MVTTVIYTLGRIDQLVTSFCNGDMKTGSADATENKELLDILWRVYNQGWDDCDWDTNVPTTERSEGESK